MISGQVKKRIILGLDPGLADTGYAVVEQKGQRLHAIAYGSLRTAARQPLAERLLSLHQQLDQVLRRYKPNLLSIELLYFARNVSTALLVGQARGVALLTALQHDLQVVEFTPLQVKQTVTSYGRADKGQVGKMVKLLYGLQKVPTPDDAADALALAYCASLK